LAGGLIPLAPDFIVAEAARALAVSVACTLLALFVFGFVKGSFTGAVPYGALCRRHRRRSGRGGGVRDCPRHFLTGRPNR
jgi:hypothetical protein